MTDCEYTPKIRPIFLLTKKNADDFDRNYVTQLLHVIPTKSNAPTLSKGKIMCDSDIHTVEKELTGITIIRDSSPPYRLLKHACWGIELPKIESWSLDEPLQQLEQIFFGKESEVLHVCSEYNLSADLIVRVFAESNNMPELTIPSSSVSFWASMGVSIGFDFYLD